MATKWSSCSGNPFPVVFLMSKIPATLRRLACTASLALSACLVSAEAASGSFYARELDLVRERSEREPEVRRQVDAIIESARAILDRPLVRRAATLAELENPGDQRSGRTDPRTWQIIQIDKRKAELFALSEADKGACHTLADELPLLAAAVRLTGDERLRARLVAQLEEFVTWDPIQRPGWSLHNGTNNLPPDGNDGVWLATGLGLAALCQTLDILPADALPPALRAAIGAQLEREIARSVADWTNKPAWFMRGKASMSNQWVVPSAGLVMAAVTAGLETHRDAYELGVANLLATLAAFGGEGAISEGAGYAMHMTAPFLYLAGRAAAEAGDTRLAEHPFLQNFPEWLALAFQPGENIVNAFDGFSLTRGVYHLFAGNITQLVALSRDPSLGWILRNQIGEGRRDLYGLLALNISDDITREPPLHAVYDRARWVVWRSGWEKDASGLWIRGGHHADQHDHHDRGHVNFIVGGRPLLIEAGTPGYAHQRKQSYFDSVAGHNVMQVGDELHPVRSPARITLPRLGDTGGEAVVEAGAGYKNVSRWSRRVRWDARSVTVTDEVVLKTPDTVLFRWHLASRESLAIERSGASAFTAALPAGEIVFPGWIGPLPEGSHWTPPAEDRLSTPAARITINADAPLRVGQETALDHTLKFRVQDNPHTLLTVRSAGPVKRLRVETTFHAEPADSPTPATP